MVSSRSFRNDHLIDHLAAGIAGAAGRISTDSLRSRPALFYPSIRARPVAPCSLTVWRRVPRLHRNSSPSVRVEPESQRRRHERPLNAARY